MRINTRFTVAVHMLALIELNKSKMPPSTSELMAKSVGTNPVVIRQLMSSLKKSGLIVTKNGIAGSDLAKSPEEITLLDIYKAVEKCTDAPLFNVHPNPNPKCFIGGNIQGALELPIKDAQRAMEQALAGYTLKEITSYIIKHT